MRIPDPPGAPTEAEQQLYAQSWVRYIHATIEACCTLAVVILVASVGLSVLAFLVGLMARLVVFAFEWAAR